jgi:hypothetical protein
MSEICEAPFAILEADGGVVEFVFAPCTRFLAVPACKIQEIKIAMDLMERIETVYCGMVEAFGLNRIAACFGDEFESELAIRMRIKNLFSCVNRFPIGISNIARYHICMLCKKIMYIWHSEFQAGANFGIELSVSIAENVYEIRQQSERRGQFMNTNSKLWKANSSGHEPETTAWIQQIRCSYP